LTQQLQSNCIGVLTAIKTRFADSLTSLSFQLAQIEQKSKVLAASLTTLVSSIKAVLTIAKATVTQIGSLLQTIVLQTRQLATQVLNLGKSLVKKDTQDK
jgi:hypothetical protein